MASDVTATAEQPGDRKPCPHDTIAEAGGLRVCMDCGQPNPKRRRRDA